MRIILDNYAPPDFVRKLLDNTPYLWYNIDVSGNLVILVVLWVRNLTLLGHRRNKWKRKKSK